MSRLNILQYISNRLIKFSLIITTAVIFTSSTQIIARAMPPPIGLDSLMISSDNSHLTYFRSGVGFNLSNSVKKPQIRRVDLRTGKLLSQSPVKIPLVDYHQSLGFTPNAERLLLLKTIRAAYPALPSNRLVMYNKSGKVLQVLKEPRKNYFEENEFRIRNKGLALSPDGKRLALLDIETSNTAVYIMDVASNKVSQRIPLPKKLHYGTYYGGGLTFNHDGKILSWLARGLDDGTDKTKLHLYRYSIYLKKFLAPIALNNDPYMYNPAIHYSPNGHFAVFAAEYSSQFHLVDLKKSKDKMTLLKGRIGYIGFSADQKHLVILDILNKKVIIRSIETGKEVSTLFVLKEGETIYIGKGVSAIQSQDLKYLAIDLKARSHSYRKDKILLFDTQNGKLIRRIEIPLNAVPTVDKSKVIKADVLKPEKPKYKGGFFSQQMKAR